MFSDIMKIEAGEYEEIVDQERLVKKIVEIQDDFNMEFQSRMDLVFFDACL
jgi:hypothetical protein